MGRAAEALVARLSTVDRKASSRTRPSTEVGSHRGRSEAVVAQSAGSGVAETSNEVGRVAWCVSSTLANGVVDRNERDITALGRSVALARQRTRRVGPLSTELAGLAAVTRVSGAERRNTEAVDSAVSTAESRSHRVVGEFDRSGADHRSWRITTLEAFDGSRARRRAGTGTSTGRGGARRARAGRS